jgi:hypothetical protein
LLFPTTGWPSCARARYDDRWTTKTTQQQKQKVRDNRLAFLRARALRRPFDDKNNATAQTEESAVLFVVTSLPRPSVCCSFSSTDDTSNEL